MKKILVTGGAGYIGSFIVRRLKEDGFEPFVIDDFSAGHMEAIEGFRYFRANFLDGSDLKKIDKLFSVEKFDGVIHMASLIQMGESFKNPGKYFRSNLNIALNLLDLVVKHKIPYVVFSSSAGVYGTPKKLPITEDSPKNPENPYGETKLMIEKILGWYEQAHGVQSVCIRYFNAAGAALNGEIGEDHPNESHIIPLLIKAALEGRTFTLFGNDYETNDGTCVRDYIHVLDLASAHTDALRYLIDGGESDVFNAGVGKGYSNMELVRGIEKLAGKFSWTFGPRRLGDADSLYADVKKIKTVLKWEPKYGLDEIIESAYKWHKKYPKGYIKIK